MVLTLLSLIIVSYLLGFILTKLMKDQFSQKLLDIPNERSSHTLPKPRGGGIGFILAFASVDLFYETINYYYPKLIPEEFILSDYVFCFLALIPLAIIGFLDDRCDVPASIRYFVQLVSATLVMIGFGVVPIGLSNFGTIGVFVAAGLTIFGITALINFYNFMDGLDGLVAGVTALQLAFFAFYLNETFLYLLVSALVGFLWWNWSPAKIFMGDVGSTVLGAVVAIALLKSEIAPINAWSAFTITLPLIGDAIYTLIRRLMKGENIFKAHRTHIYQRLHKSGLSHAKVSISYIALTLIFIGNVFISHELAISINLILTFAAIAIGEIYLLNRQTSRKE
jgi:UDP-N-acetylmuramyl pentapeptide phosphotransferase/UDP-N-acetylglucosamine-1-phosphate transferase